MVAKVKGKGKTPKPAKPKPAPTIDDFRAKSQFGKVPEVAKILNVSRQTVYKMIAAKQLPAVMVSECVRVRWDEVEQFIANGGSPVTNAASA